MSNYDPANAKAYNDAIVIRYYSRLSGLTVQEQAALDPIADAIRDRPILDLGIGAGRTTPELVKLSADYVGVDYSQGMVDICRAKYPDRDIRLGDARDMRCFEDGRFGFVLFSFNGIDTVNHADRLRILKEVRRVLRPGGSFVFSSHSRTAYEAKEAAQARKPLAQKLRDGRDILTKVLAAPRRSNPEVRKLLNRLKNKPREERTEQYAIVNDSGHDYSLLTYYISPVWQRRQLLEAGFGEVAPAIDEKGRAVADCAETPWLYYRARK